MVRERRGKKSKSKDVEEAAPVPDTLQVPEEPAINRFFKREKSPFEVGDRKDMQVASSNAIIDKACVMDISGGAAKVAAKVDEYINLLFTDYCALDQASCGDISKEIKIVVIEEESEPTSIQPALSVEQEEQARKEAEEAAIKAAEEAEAARVRAEQEEAARIAREEEERKAREEAERLAAEEAERKRKEEEEEAKKKAAEEEKRKKAEEEAKKKAEAEEKAKKEAEEKARKEAEEEAARKKAEEEAYDSDKELIPPKEEEGISWEAVEEEAPLVPDVLQDLLEQREAETAETGDETEKEMTERDRDLEWQRQRQMMRPPLVISHLKSRAVPTGSIAKLTCNVSGPGIMVRWLKNGNPIEINPNKYKFFNSEGLLSLEILDVTKKDAADYTCFVKNKNGETETVANITVYDSLDVNRPTPPTFITIKDRDKPPEPAPEPEKVELDKWGDPIRKKKRKVRPLSLWAQREKFEFTVHLPKTMTCIEDRNARFICGTTGGGNIEILWYKDGKKIRFERFPRILDYTRNQTGCIGIECTTTKDAGTYTCKFTNTDTGEVLETSCELVVMPRLKRIKELSEKIPPAFVRKLQYTYKPEDDQLVVHCTILANPEPSIKWYVNKVPLHLCPLPRISVFNHPDDVHEHTIASLVILGPTYLDNGDYVIEVENDAGFERRAINIQFQTEEEYNEKYFRRYMHHKECFKLHEYGPNEVRWEDVVPEVKEFHPYVPEDEKPKLSADGKVRKRRKKHRYVKKKVVQPWGDEEEIDVTDEDASSESYTASEGEEKEEPEDEEEEEEDGGWGMPGEGGESGEEEEETAPPSAPADDGEQPAAAEEAPAEVLEEPPAKEPTPPPPKEPTPPPPKEPTPPPPPAEEEEAAPQEKEEEEDAAEAIVEPLKKMSFQVPEFETIEPTIDIYDPDYVRKQHESLEYPYIYRRPKFHITEYQLRKKFQFVNKLIDIELVKGKTLRLESFIACLGKVTPEWRFKGHVIGETFRRSIEFNPHRNLTAVEIENTRLQDSGVYTVVWYNDYTEPMIDSCRVHIVLPKAAEEFDTPPTFTRLLTDTYKEWTDELILDCHVRGVPRPTIQWFKNDIEINPVVNNRYETKQDDDGNCTLTILHPIKSCDRGRYVVVAKNKAGEERCDLRVWFRGKVDDDMAERAEYRRTQKMYKSRHVKPQDEDEWGGKLYHSKRLDKEKDYDHRYKLTWLSRIISTTLAQGSTLKLVAFVAGKYPQFEWYFDDIPLVHGRKYRQIVTNNGKGCLIINNVQPCDSGTYRLIVKNYANSIDCEATVTVYAYEYKNFEPPLFINTLTDAYDQVTNKLIIECNLKPSLDFSAHKIKWYKDDVEIRPSYLASGGIPTTYEQELDDTSGRVKLIITYPMNTDCGLYRCCVLDRNSQRVDEISHLVYKIFNPPPHVPLEELEFGERKRPIVFDNYLSDIVVDEGGKSVRLNCKISQCNAQSEIKWYRNGEELAVEDCREKYRFTKSYNRLCLEILHPTLSDAGAYECRVKNQYNEISSKCNVHVNERSERRERTRTSTRELDTSYIDMSSGATVTGGLGDYYFNDSLEDSNKVLLERSTREIAARIHRSNNLYDPSSQPLERPLFATPLSDRTVTENSSSVKFTCSLMSSDCDVSWERNGVPLRSSSKYSQTFTDGLAILEISDVTDADAGKYSCVASNKFGDALTSAKLKVYSGFTPSVCMPPTVMRQMKESYNLHHDLLTLECRVRGTPKPHIQWMKDGEYIIPGDKYEQHELPDGTCKLVIKSPDPEEDSGTYTCEAECNGCSDSISHNVHYEGSVENQFNRIHRYYHRDPLKPYIKTGLVDANIPSNGSIALFIEAQANCEAEWFRERWTVDHKPPKRYIFNDGNGFFACVINHATMDESAKYTCKVTNPYGSSQTSSFIDIINPNSVGKGQKPPIFLTRPQFEIKIRAGDPFSMSFRVQGEPKPRIQWHKGAKEITNASRTIKEVFNDYVRFSIKESKESDSGIYFITARNKHGVDRAFCHVTVRERQELIGSDSQQLSSNIDYTDVSYMKNPPGQIPNEPTVIDSSANHLSLSWMKPQCNDAAPVIGYRIDAWLVGKEGDATWREIGTSPIAGFDVFNLKAGCEYHFRVTPRNRYGYGPSTQTTYPVMFGDVVKLPEFTKILSGQLKALLDHDITLECVAMGSPRPDIVWYKDGIRIDSNERRTLSVIGPLCRLVIRNITEADNGRYTCEASNKEGRVSTFARVQTVADPKLFEADNKLKRNIEADLEQLTQDEILPQFTMRLRDRRVQCTYPVRLTCQVLAVPQATIEWYKDGVRLVEDERFAFLQEDQFSTLEISRTYLEDSGQYTVTARNELGSVSCHCNLIVDKGIRAYISPEFIKTLDMVYTCGENEEIRLQAHVEAYPSVGVTWHHNGIRLRPSRRIQASLDTDGIVTLTISEATATDAGTYTCVASNAVGRVECTCRVNITENPDKKSRVIPSIVAPDAPYSREPLFLAKPRSSEAYEGDTVIIMCEVIGDPKPEVLWLRDFLKPEYYKDAPHFRSVIGNESEYRLEIPHAKIEYTGTYSVIASNCYGQAKAIISLQIYAKDLGRSMDAGSIIHGNIETLPRIVKHLKDLRCCDGDAVTLECHVEGLPEPNVFWEKDGKILHDRSTEHRQNFNGRKATLSIPRVFPEDEGQYCLVACNNMGRVKSSACIIVDVPEEKENLLSRQLSRPMTFLSPNSTPRSTPRSTPARSMSPLSLHLSMISNNINLTYRQRRYRFSAPKFYSVPHNRVCEEGDTVRFQCAIAGHPVPWSTWDKDGIIVTPSQRFLIRERDDMRYLEIEEVSFEDAGLYRITLENDYGRIEATARLDIIKSDKIHRRGIRASSAPNRDSTSMTRRIMGYSTRIGGRMALAAQRAQSIPAKKASVYHNGYDISDSSRLTVTQNETEILLEIDNVKTYDEGEYTLMLEDEAGIATTTTTFAKVHYVEDEIFEETIVPKVTRPLAASLTSIEGIPLDLTLQIDCEVPFDYVWLRNDEPLLNCEDFVYIDHGCGTLTLRIQDPFVFDSGKYECVITTLAGECTSECSVEIEELNNSINLLDVIPEFIKTPLPSIAVPGCPVSFCTRVTPIDSLVEWSVCGCEVTDDTKGFKIERLDDGLNVLHVLSVDHKRSGEVKCRAISSNNPQIFNVYHTNLTVLPVPISERYEPIESVLESNSYSHNNHKSSLVHDLDLTCFITKRPEDRTVLVGDSIELNVSYIGRPEPTVRWMRAERLIGNEPNTIIITKNGHSRLIINNITSDQSGKYSVEIMNEHSTDLASSSVAVEGVPDAPISLSYSKGSDRVAVAWSGPAYDGGCMLTGFILEMQQDDGEWKEVATVADSLAYTVKNLTPDNKYKFRVRAQNVHGNSPPSKSTEEIVLVKPSDASGNGRDDEDEESEEEYSKEIPYVKSGGDFKARFEIMEELGKGRFGTVHRVMERETGLILAAKIIKCIKAMDRKKVQDEIKIMKSLQHPKLLQLSASFETQKEIIMVMEYLNGGELFERVVADDFTLTERDCILFMRQICEGVAYMHSKYVVHLDLKPENIMCHTRTSHQIKIIDFGLAQNLEPGKQVRVLFGTPEFCPPEIINYEPIGLQSDMWSLGVICYVLLSGLSPFMGETDVSTFSNITRAYYDFDDEAFDAISEEAKDFIAGLLVYRKENRMNARQCLESKWLSQHYDVMGSTKLCTDKLKKFIIRRKWQKTGNAIRAIGKMKNLTLSAASRKSASGVSSNSSPRPSISGPIYANAQNFVSDTRITSVDEELAEVGRNLPTANGNDSSKSTKDPRICNERSDSGFSECSNCSTPSASCACNHHTNSLSHEPKADTIIEERSSVSSSSSSLEPHGTTASDATHVEEEEERHADSDHDIHSEISSLEYDTSHCDSIAVSLRVPTRRELFLNEQGEPMSEIERRKVSLENKARKVAATSVRQEFSLEKLKKTSKVALLMEKFEGEATSPVVSPKVPAHADSQFKFKSTVTIERGLRAPTNPIAVTNSVKTCANSLNSKSATNRKISDSPPLPAAKSPRNSPATSPAAATATFRLSDRVREATERLSKPKQQPVPQQQATATTTMTTTTTTMTDKTTKASILKQNANFVRSKDFWKR